MFRLQFTQVPFKRFDLRFLGLIIFYLALQLSLKIGYYLLVHQQIVFFIDQDSLHFFIPVSEFVALDCHSKYLVFFLLFQLFQVFLVPCFEYLLLVFYDLADRNLFFESVLLVDVILKIVVLLLLR